MLGLAIVLFVLVLAIFGRCWRPIQRMRRRRTSRAA
jgi:hypothetical protein